MLSRAGQPALSREDLEAALGGDKVFLRSLVRTLTPVIQAAAGKAVLGSGLRRDLRGVTEDLTQEVFLVLFQDDGAVLRSWDPKVRPLDAYVTVIARRRAISLLRGRHFQARRAEGEPPADGLDAADPGVDPERHAASKDDLRWLVQRCRRELSPQGRQIFEQLYVLERSVEEVQADMGLKANAVYQWKHRLRKLALRWLAERRDRDLQPAGHDHG